MIHPKPITYWLKIAYFYPFNTRPLLPLTLKSHLPSTPDPLLPSRPSTLPSLYPPPSFHSPPHPLLPLPPCHPIPHTFPSHPLPIITPSTKRTLAIHSLHPPLLYRSLTTSTRSLRNNSNSVTEKKCFTYFIQVGSFASMFF